VERSATIRVAATTVVLVVLGACGGGGGDAAPTSSTPATTTTEAASDVPAPSAGCSSDVAGGPVDEPRTLVVDGTERTYLYLGPERAPGDGPAPLVIDFHGLAEGADLHRVVSRLDALATREGFALATPSGTGEPVAWGVSTDASNPDLRFVDALIDEIGLRDCVDLRRVYAIGLSNGAMLSSTLACASSDRIAAIATVAGLTDPPACAPDRAVPVISFHGTDDAILLFNGGVGDLGTALEGGSPSMPEGYVADLDGAGIPAAAAAWAARNGCEATPTDDRVAPDVLRRSYTCPQDAEVVSYVVEGGGHSWPGSEMSASLASVIGRTTTSIDANELAWAFFQRHRTPTT